MTKFKAVVLQVDSAAGSAFALKLSVKKLNL